MECPHSIELRARRSRWTKGPGRGWAGGGGGKAEAERVSGSKAPRRRERRAAPQRSLRDWIIAYRSGG